MKVASLPQSARLQELPTRRGAVIALAALGLATGTSSLAAPGQLSVQLKTGATVQVPDFTKENQPRGVSAQNGYQVAGSDGGDFQILYFPPSYFLVSLSAKPLGKTRRLAEAALRTKLHLTNAVMCQLRIDVDTVRSVDPEYSGQSLGLSFCPGAVRLP